MSSLSAEMIFSTSDSRDISFKQMIDDLKRVNVVFIGEYHHNEEHHKHQLNIIKTLNDNGISIAIGLEMFNADSQDELDKWIKKDISLRDFQKIYDNNWTFPWYLYEGIFLYARDNNIPMIGLNISRSIIKKVSTHGVSSLTDEEKKNLPTDLVCEIDSRAMEILKSAYYSHSKENFVHFCEAQTLWDKVMAMNIMKFLEKNPERLLVVLAGTGHSMKFGIPHQIRKNSELFIG